MSIYDYKPPSPDVIKQVLADYGCRRWQAARQLKIALVTFNRYCLPKDSKNHKTIPEDRWQRLLEFLTGRHADKGAKKIEIVVHVRKT